MARRDAQEELARHRAEESDMDRRFHAMQADHAVALRRAEENGYAKGLKDYIALETRLAAMRRLFIRIHLRKTGAGLGFRMRLPCWCKTA
jgi:hypothetical protein